MTTCPFLGGLRRWIEDNRAMKTTNLSGPSPPAIFVGQWGYPKVSTGPLVPPFTQCDDASIMDAPEQWLHKTFDELLRYRLSLFMGKAPMTVASAKAPNRMLQVVQELVMADQPTETEVWLSKRPNLEAIFMPRLAPIGPSGPMTKAVLAENPRVPGPVDAAVSDKDLQAQDGIVKLHRSGIPQQHLTRLLSIGLLGRGSQRRLVPTEWSITAVDDILGKELRREVLNYPSLSEFQVFGSAALANNVQVLLLPSMWMFEALEAWLRSPNSQPVNDFELTKGRSSYPRNLLGAYHATRLPILEYLTRIRKQAGAVVFLEVSDNWIPLGVWRFRELCREALKAEPIRTSTMEEALTLLSPRLLLPIQRWIRVSEVLRYHRTQLRIEKWMQ
ncbi:hypothetical protein CL673_08540 [Candidatus Bathyarchaeota archaeon]|nr:hypothetical protein [Candidatus Bathyarchaeota archaeon]